MKPVAVPADAERLAMDYLNIQLPLHASTATAGISVPVEWDDATTPFVQVALDGTPETVYPLMAVATIRLTAWHTTATGAKQLVGLAQGLMLAHGGGGGIQSVRFLTGTLPTRDTKTGAELASATVAVRVEFATA